MADNAKTDSEIFAFFGFEGWEGGIPADVEPAFMEVSAKLSEISGYSPIVMVQAISIALGGRLGLAVEGGETLSQIAFEAGGVAEIEAEKYLSGGEG